MSTFYSFFFQILPEKYCYHRKVEDSTNQPIDCVICMTTIDLTQRTSEYMVNCEILFGISLCRQLLLVTHRPPSCRWHLASIYFTQAVYSVGWTLRWSALLAGAPYHQLR